MIGSSAADRVVPIALLPGNHDHELAAYEAYVQRFEEYNVHLVQEVVDVDVERRIVEQRYEG